MPDTPDPFFVPPHVFCAGSRKEILPMPVRTRTARWS